MSARERPIIFSAPMVRAILESRKTQTRRIAKCDGNPFHSASGAWVAMNAKKGVITEMRCPYGEMGDRLWVRESFRKIMGQSGGWIETDYRATYQHGDRMGDHLGVKPKWMPSIHMPRAASRITLEITEVRLERLIGISADDAEAEGWPGPDDKNTIRSAYPIGWYAHLWDQINGKRHPWDSNPWVWVVCFAQRVEEFRDRLAGRTRDFDSRNVGSNPTPGTSAKSSAELT